MAVVGTEFTTKMYTKGNAIVFWCDFMKMGRLGNEKLNDASELLAASLQQRPASTVALVIVPYLISAHVRSGPFGELKSFDQDAFNNIFALTVFP